jgi:hypothetical protein
MLWELYEVWSVVDGHEDLIDTTKSLTEAREWATKAIQDDGLEEVVIYRENEDGDLEELERYTSS